MHWLFILGLHAHLVAVGHRECVLEHLTWVVTRWSEVVEWMAVWGFLLCLVLILGVRLRRIVAKLHRVLEVRVLHGIVDIFLLLSHLEPGILLLAHVEDSHLIALVISCSSILSSIGRNDLNITMAGQKFHVRWAIQENFSWDRRERISKIAQLVTSMCEAAVFSKLTHSCLLKIATDLGLVI